MVSQDKSRIHLVTEKWREGKQDLLRDGWDKPASDKMVESITEWCESKVASLIWIQVHYLNVSYM